jgi:hypothetical protein
MEFATFEQYLRFLLTQASLRRQREEDAIQPYRARRSARPLTRSTRPARPAPASRASAA